MSEEILIQLGERTATTQQRPLQNMKFNNQAAQDAKRVQ